MDLTGLIIALAVIGGIWYLVTTYIPMPAPIKTVITIIAVVALCLLLLQLLGVGHVGLHRL